MEAAIRLVSLVLLLAALAIGRADDSAVAPAGAAGIIIRECGSVPGVALGSTDRFLPAPTERFPAVLHLLGTGESGDGTGATAAGQRSRRPQEDAPEIIPRRLAEPQFRPAGRPTLPPVSKSRSLLAAGMILVTWRRTLGPTPL